MRPAPTALPLHVGGTLSPTARLAGAIVGRALNDARLGDQAAVRWLATSSSGLNFWAAVLNVEPEDLVERAARALNASAGFQARALGRGPSSPACSRVAHRASEENL